MTKKVRAQLGVPTAENVQRREAQNSSADPVKDGLHQVRGA